MKKAVIILAFCLIAILFGIVSYIYFSGPKLPVETNRIIDQTLSSELPELIKGKAGLAKNGNVGIWYESISPKGTIKGSIILVMGIANDAMAWPDYFIQPLVDAGFQVIRYDHRGTGLSDWMDNWDEKNPYSLEDMADDGMAVLDTLNIEKAHVVGISMGGMIAQTMAINYPARVQSLASLMSSGYIEDLELPPISKRLVFDLVKIHLKYGLIKSEKNTIKLHIAARATLRGNSATSLDLESVSTQVLYNLRKRKGYNDKASPQHIAATSFSGSRYNGLKRLNIPSVIVHGKSDPFIPFSHGVKCAQIIPNSDTLWIEGMGHDIPKEFAAPIISKIVENINKAVSAANSGTDGR